MWVFYSIIKGPQFQLVEIHKNGANQNGTTIEHETQTLKQYKFNAAQGCVKLRSPFFVP